MPINDNDSRVKRTKKLIRQGLVEIAKTKSISKITVKELTDLVEINRGTFYLHYKDVFDLVESIENEIYTEFDKLISSIQTTELLKKPIDICEEFLMFIYERKDVFSMLMGANGDSKFIFRIGEILNEKVLIIFQNIFPNMNRSTYDAAYNYGKFGLVGLTNCWFTEHPEWSPRQVAETWFNLTILGLWGILGDEGKEVLINANNSD